MKRWMLVMAVVLAGCEPWTAPPHNQPLPPPRPVADEFHYRERVVVTDGFYAGQHGVVAASDGGWRYCVQLDDTTRHWICREWLRKDSR